MTKTSLAVRETILTKLRRDLIGPNPTPEDADLAEEILPEEPSKWYLTGWIAPTQDGTSPLDEDDVDAPAEETLAGWKPPAPPPMTKAPRRTTVRANASCPPRSACPPPCRLPPPR